MFHVIIFILLVAAAIGLPIWAEKRLRERAPIQGKGRLDQRFITYIATNQKTTRGTLGVLALLWFVGLSLIWVPQDQIGHLKKVLGGKSLPKGAIIAVNGERGPQAEILGPGVNFLLFGKVRFDIEMLPVVHIKEGELGIITAADGKPLAEGQYLARPWASTEEMLDARKFLTDGGQKGMQLTVLKPGDYRLNHYLFDVQSTPATQVATGTTAVIKSNVDEKDGCARPVIGSDANNQLATPIVGVGCTGVWDTPKTPGAYYLNPRAYHVTHIPTRAVAWEYKGGYIRRDIDLIIQDDGSITQKETSMDVKIPEGAADGAIVATVEGWRIPVELRVLVQVNPAEAPRVVASVGTLQDVENNIAMPTIRSVLRNVTASRKVLDLVEQRQELEAKIEAALAPELKKAGVQLKEVRMADPVIPPELLVARRREQVAGQLEETYKREKAAQTARAEKERERATADQQVTLVEAELAKRAAEDWAQQARLRGEGEKQRLMNIAAGERARADVLGAKAAADLAFAQLIIEAVRENPELVVTPETLVEGSSGGLEGAAALLGRSNVSKALASKPGSQK